LVIAATLQTSGGVELTPWLMSIIVAVVILGVAVVAIVVLVCYYHRRMKIITGMTLIHSSLAYAQTHSIGLPHFKQSEAPIFES